MRRARSIPARGRASRGKPARAMASAMHGRSADAPLHRRGLDRTSRRHAAARPVRRGDRVAADVPGRRQPAARALSARRSRRRPASGKSRSAGRSGCRRSRASRLCQRKLTAWTLDGACRRPSPSAMRGCGARDATSESIRESGLRLTADCRSRTRPRSGESRAGPRSPTRGSRAGAPRSRRRYRPIARPMGTCVHRAHRRPRRRPRSRVRRAASLSAAGPPCARSARACQVSWLVNGQWLAGESHAGEWSDPGVSDHPGDQRITAMAEGGAWCRAALEGPFAPRKKNAAEGRVFSFNGSRNLRGCRSCRPAGRRARRRVPPPGEDASRMRLVVVSLSPR